MTRIQVPISPSPPSPYPRFWKKGRLKHATIPPRFGVPHDPTRNPRPVAILRLARGKGNSLTAEFLDALIAALDDLEKSPARSAVLTGQGTVFSAGVDLFEATGQGGANLPTFLSKLSHFTRRLFTFPKPIVAAVNGHAIAGGCVIALACDYRIMARGTGTMGLTEILVGVPFPSMPMQIVRSAVAPQFLQEVIYTGRTYNPDDALHRGLVNELADPADLVPRARAIAEQLGQIIPATFRLTKQVLRWPALDIAARSLPAADADVLDAWSSPEVQASIRAYAAKTLKRNP